MKVWKFSIIHRINQSKMPKKEIRSDLMKAKEGRFWPIVFKRFIVGRIKEKMSQI